MKFDICQDSRKGRRGINQDRIGHCYSRDALFMAVADGMGGYPRGEVAAEAAVRSMAAAFRNQAAPRLADPAAFLREAIQGAHRDICDICARHGEAGADQSPRTTCVACVVQRGVAFWAHAGDSRLYHLRGGAVLSRTRDHSVVQRLVDTGQLRKEAVAEHPERNRVYSCLGGRQAPRMTVSRGVPLAAGDILLLCSDGVWGPLSSRIVAGVLAEPDLQHAVRQLLDLAELRAGSACDNLSAVAIRWSR